MATAMLRFLHCPTVAYRQSINEITRMSYVISKRYAGHSHWQNIKTTKAAKDVNKSRAYNKVVHEIVKAIKRENGCIDPKLNKFLADAIEFARKNNVPSKIVDSAIKRVSNYKILSFWYYYKIGAIALIVRVDTDSSTYARKITQEVAKKYGLTKAESSILTMFTHQGLLIAEPPADMKDAKDKSIEDAIEVGAEEVEIFEEEPLQFQFICDAPSMNIIKSKLEGRKYNITSTMERYIPLSPIELSQDELNEVNAVIASFQEIPEVSEIFDNIAC